MSFENLKFTHGAVQKTVWVLEYPFRRTCACEKLGMKDLSETSVAQNRNMATDRAQGQNLGTRPKLGHYVRLQGGENPKIFEFQSKIDDSSAP